MDMNPIPSPLKLARKNILHMEPYTCARMEYTEKGGIFLDANENPFGVYNRYPDLCRPNSNNGWEVKIGFTGFNFIGNGSDEIIDLLVRIFCEPGRDRVLTFSPTYGMYDVACRINDVELLTIPLNTEFQIDKEAYLEKIKNPSFKMVIACSPNNPTGNVLDHLELIAGSFPGIVVIDEAYNDFSKALSYVTLTKQYPNLVILQTFSKAWGLAGARVGMAFAEMKSLDCSTK
jgi:histidinol-phosphate aminotransferase